MSSTGKFLKFLEGLLSLSFNSILKLLISERAFFLAYRIFNIYKNFQDSRKQKSERPDVFAKSDRPEPYSKPSQTSTIEFFAEIVNGWNLSIFAKISILDVWQSSWYGSGLCILK